MTATTTLCQYCDADCFDSPCDARREAAEQVAVYAIRNGAGSMIAPALRARVTAKYGL